MYDAVDDGRARPTHAAQDGKIYPIDHPFWRAWWPPNGHRCRCSARTLTEAEAEARGGVRDKVDGMPDEGFQTNPGHTPGEARAFRTYLTGKLGNYSTHLRQAFLEDAAQMPFNLMSRHLHERDIESMRTLLWAQEQGGMDGYEDWIDVLDRDRAKGGGIAGRGRAYPVERIPAHVARRLSIEPRLALVVMEDKGVAHLYRDVKREGLKALKKGEVKDIPKRFLDQGTEWYEDTENPGEFLAAWKRGGGKWIKVVIRANHKFKGGRRANVVVSGGVVDRRNLGEGRYKKISH